MVNPFCNLGIPHDLRSCQLWMRKSAYKKHLDCWLCGSWCILAASWSWFNLARNCQLRYVWKRYVSRHLPNCAVAHVPMFGSEIAFLQHSYQIISIFIIGKELTILANFVMPTKMMARVCRNPSNMALNQLLKSLCDFIMILNYLDNF